MIEHQIEEVLLERVNLKESNVILHLKGIIEVVNNTIKISYLKDMKKIMDLYIKKNTSINTMSKILK